MIVVSDSTPLITLMKAGRLDILKSLFGEVLLPEAVFSEVTSNYSYRDEADIIRGSAFIKVVKVTNLDRVAFLQRVTGLDRGESEAIIFADESKADLLLMDEAAGRKVAHNMSLRMTGSVGVLLRAYQTGLLSADEIDNAFVRIRESNRHISENLLRSALEAVHGKR